MAELAARCGVHPNLIANRKRKAREEVLAAFSETKERQESSREAEIKELRAKIGELVIEGVFLSKASVDVADYVEEARDHAELARN